MQGMRINVILHHLYSLAQAAQRTNQQPFNIKQWDKWQNLQVTCNPVHQLTKGLGKDCCVEPCSAGQLSNAYNNHYESVDHAYITL